MALNKQKEENKKRKEEEAERVRVSRLDNTIVANFKIGLFRFTKLKSIDSIKNHLFLALFISHTGKEIFKKKIGRIKLHKNSDVH